MLKKVFVAFILTVALISLPGVVFASTLEIIESPQTDIGNFIHNLFSNGGPDSQGTTLAWFTLTDQMTSTYNPDTGLLNAYFEVYDDVELTESIGRVSANGSLPGSEFNDNDGGLVGALEWVMNVDPGSRLYRHIELSGLQPDNMGGFTMSIDYYDIFYNMIDGRHVNSWDDGYLSLFGYTDLPYPTYGSDYACLCPMDPVSVGTNLVLLTAPDTVIPEPASMLLLGAGLVGLSGLRRKKR